MIKQVKKFVPSQNFIIHRIFVIEWTTNERVKLKHVTGDVKEHEYCRDNDEHTSCTILGLCPHVTYLKVPFRVSNGSPNYSVHQLTARRNFLRVPVAVWYSAIFNAIIDDDVFSTEFWDCNIRHSYVVAAAYICWQPVDGGVTCLCKYVAKTTQSEGAQFVNSHCCTLFDAICRENPSTVLWRQDVHVLDLQEYPHVEGHNSDGRDDESNECVERCNHSQQCVISSIYKVKSIIIIGLYFELK